MKRLVVFSGAGMSAESGIPTFRGNDGLWENYSIEDVATPEAWAKNPSLVLDFYNMRRKNLLEVHPNEGHRLLAELEKYYDVRIVTQNIDNLHERAGSTDVMHLHGELMKVRSTGDPELIYTMEDWELRIGDTCEKGCQLRPHIVWFGEMVPLMDKAVELVQTADIFLVIGTSLQVYPAAGIVDFVPDKIPKYLIDPTIPGFHLSQRFRHIAEGSSEGMKILTNLLLEGAYS
jgi:NAD-dependent deacetylase